MQFSWWAKTQTCLAGPSVVTRVSLLLVHTSVDLHLIPSLGLATSSISLAERLPASELAQL
jgi:hypothetical protein